MAVLFGTAVFGQENPAEQIFKKVAGAGECTTLTVNKNVLKLAAGLQKDEPEVQQFLSGLESVKILAAGKKVNDAGYKEMIRRLSADYDELMRVDENDGQVIFLMKQDGEVIRELLLLANGEDENAMIIVRGEIRLQELMQMKKESANGKNGLAFLMDL